MDKWEWAEFTEMRRQRNEALQLINQAVQFVAAWANNHPGSDGNASRIGTRLVDRMQAAVEESQDKAKGAQ